MRMRKMGPLAALLLVIIVASANVVEAVPMPSARSSAAGAGLEQPYHFGFKKSRGGSPASIDEEGFKPLLQRHGAIFTGNPARKSLYLTFDNGYENGYTAPILDVLRVKKVPAAFFVTGHYVKDQPELLKRMVREGHIVGNHSWNHPDMTTICPSRARRCTS